MAALAINGWMIAGALPILKTLPPLSGSWRALELIISFGGVIVLIWAWVRWYEGRSLRTLGFFEEGSISKACRGLLLGVLGLSASVLILIAAGYGAIRGIQFPQLFPMVFALLGTLVQASAEEIAVRGFVLPTVASRWGVSAGVLVSAGLFALLHGGNRGLTTLVVINLFLFGILLAMYALYEGGLWGVCLWHTGWNWAQGELFSNQPGDSPVFRYDSWGPSSMSGGPFGIEGGFPVTVVVVTGIIAVGVLLRRFGCSTRGSVIQRHTE